MVWGLLASAGFQPFWPTDSRIFAKPSRRVSSRRKWVCMSMMNWPRRPAARSAAISGVAASAALASNTGP